MIPVVCRTYVDAGKGKDWPIRLWTKPNVGELIKCNSSLLTLQVVKIIHTSEGLEIELGLTDAQREIVRLGGKI